jgi:hypothetical protein
LLVTIGNPGSITRDTHAGIGRRGKIAGQSTRDVVAELVNGNRQQYAPP